MVDLMSLDPRPLVRAFAITLGLIGPAMAQERILISSDWGKVTAELVDNNATRSLVQMLPLTIEMRDHLRQEKTGNLPSPFARGRAAARFLDRDAGTLEFQSLCDLLPRRPRSSARDYLNRPSDR
jgi:Cyclophilin-like family